MGWAVGGRRETGGHARHQATRDDGGTATTRSGHRVPQLKPCMNETFKMNGAFSPAVEDLVKLERLVHRVHNLQQHRVPACTGRRGGQAISR